MDASSPGSANGSAHDLILTKLDAIEKRLSRIESSGGGGLPPSVTSLLDSAPKAIGAFTDMVDERMACAAARGQDIDRAVRNALAALIETGASLSPERLEAVGRLLRSELLGAKSAEVAGKLGKSLSEAAAGPCGSVGPLGMLSALRNEDVMRATAFMVEVARRFGASLQRDDRADLGRH